MCSGRTKFRNIQGNPETIQWNLPGKVYSNQRSKIHLALREWFGVDIPLEHQWFLCVILSKKMLADIVLQIFPMALSTYRSSRTQLLPSDFLAALSKSQIE